LEGQRIIRQRDRRFACQLLMGKAQQILVASAKDVQADVVRLGAELAAPQFPVYGFRPILGLRLSERLRNDEVQSRNMVDNYSSQHRLQLGWILWPVPRIKDH
jgi:hypothetical protein